MWVWNTASILADSSQQQGLFSFCQSKGINVLYLYSGSGPVENCKSLIQMAHDQGIKVEALDGAKEWSLSENHATVLAMVQGILDYNQTAPPNERFDGVHLDIEPYLLSGFFDSSSIPLQYLDLLKKIRTLLQEQASTLNFAVDIPRWYDAAPVSVTFNSREDYLSHHILDLVDAIGVMDYRDNSTSIINDGADEVAYAGQLGKKAVLGVETDLADPETVTFYEEGEQAMDAALAIALTHYHGVPGFGGLAIHHFSSYRTMAQ